MVVAIHADVQITVQIQAIYVYSIVMGTRRVNKQHYTVIVTIHVNYNVTNINVRDYGNYAMDMINNNRLFSRLK